MFSIKTRLYVDVSDHILELIREWENIENFEFHYNRLTGNVNRIKNELLAILKPRQNHAQLTIDVTDTFIRIVKNDTF